MAALAAVILLISSGCASSQTATGKKHTIALVTKSTTSAFWHSVKAGAGAAAAEYHRGLPARCVEDMGIRNALFTKKPRA